MAMVGFKGYVAWFGICTALVLAAGPARAQMGLDPSRMIAGAINLNTERALLFRPKLVIARGGTGSVVAAALSRDERYLVSAVGDNSVRLWDLFIGREVARLRGHSGRIQHLALSGDGHYALTAAADHTIRLWNLARIGEVMALQGDGAALTGVAFGPDGNRAATASADGVVTVWSLPAGRSLASFRAHDAGAIHLVTTPDGRLLSGGKDGQVIAWDLSNGRRLANAPAGNPVTSLAVSPDGRRLVVATADGTLQLWDAATLGKRTAWKAHDRAVTTVAFDAGGNTVISGDAGGTMRSWSAADGALVREFGKHGGAVTFTALGKDGTLALSSSEDGTTHLWGTRTGAQLLTLISTEGGWAVVDSRGRFDGSEQALAGIEWQDKDATVPIDDFSERYYTSALLARTLNAPDGLDNVPSVTDGVHYPPKVSFAAPTSGGAVTARRLSVEVVAEADRGGGVAEIRLYRNGRLLAPFRADPQAGGAQAGAQRLTNKYEVDLPPGSTQLSATAVNAEKIESRPRTLTFHVAGTMPVGALHVLVVGINRYRAAGRNLNYGRPDAEAIANFFREAHPGAARIAEIQTLFDDNATKANILAALARMRAASPEDALVVYMAGHGVSFGNDWYFIPYEVEDMTNRDAVQRQGLSATELKLEMESQTADRSLVLIDSCTSGAAVNPLTDYSGMKSLRLLARSAGTHIVAATDQQQDALEFLPLGHGFFTYAVLRALGGKVRITDANGDITASGLIRHVEQEVPRLVSDANIQRQQHPTAYSRGVDFILSHPDG